MKRIVTVIIIVAAFISCQREELAEPAKSIHVFKAYMEDVRNETKTMIGEDNRIVWSDGDEIRFFGSYSGIYDIDPESVGTSEGVFSFNRDGGIMNTLEFGTHVENLVIYPPYISQYDRNRTSKYELAANECEIQDCVLPPSQSYCFGNFSMNSFPMVAVTTSPEDNINFKNLCGVMKLQLKGDVIIRSIVVQGNDNEKLSGYCDVIASAAAVPRVVMLEDAHESVRMDCGEGVTLNKVTPTDFYIVIPPVVFENGFKVTVSDTDGDKYVIETTMKNLVERSAILVMPAVDLTDFAVDSGDDEIIDFKDPVVKELLLRQGIDLNGDGEVSYIEASSATSLSFVIDGGFENSGYPIIEFDEFQYFTSVTDITRMFMNCPRLQSIVLPDTLTEIGEDAFAWCHSLRHVKIPNIVRIIGDSAFSGCFSLEQIDLPESLEIIGAIAFGSCYSLEQIELPEFLEVIDYGAFAESNLKSIELPSSLKVIGEDAFRESKLVSVELPSSLISLGDDVFSDCPDLMEINVKEGALGYYSLDGVLYSNDGTLLTFPPAKPCDDYSVPEGITSIGASAFSGCIRLQSISLPNSVKYIGHGAFSGCI